jgi:hypothetical protein
VFTTLRPEHRVCTDDPKSRWENLTDWQCISVSTILIPDSRHSNAPYIVSTVGKPNIRVNVFVVVTQKFRENQVTNSGPRNKRRGV